MNTLGPSRSLASFRDPSGFVFRRGDAVYRQVNRSYRDDYDRLIGSGLYGRLVDDRWLIPHEESDVEPPAPVPSYKVLRPDQVPFLSYSYEWCFGQLKDAAQRTLEIQRRALEHGMILKDASAYNIQFKDGRPVLIDTLSFETYREGEPWAAYRQFCQHFLAPLALMSLSDVRLNQLCRTNLDGIPLDLAARLLPWRSWPDPARAIHIHLHARFQTARARDLPPGSPVAGKFGRKALLGLIDQLEAVIGRLRWEPKRGTWADYYGENLYSEEALARKEEIVAAYLDRIRPRTAWDLGANTGRFSRLAAARGTSTVAFDADPGCVERNYREVSNRSEPCLLPLLQDLTNPSPAIGWQNRERSSLLERGPVDLALALALVHHLAIANNLPFTAIAEFLHAASHWLIIEFVPKGDPQVARLLGNRKDVFPDYHDAEFQRCFQPFFQIEAAEPLPDCERVIYLMKARRNPEGPAGLSTHF